MWQRQAKVQRIGRMLGGDTDSEEEYDSRAGVGLLAIAVEEDVQSRRLAPWVREDDHRSMDGANSGGVECSRTSEVECLRQTEGEHLAQPVQGVDLGNGAALAASGFSPAVDWCLSGKTPQR